MSKLGESSGEVTRLLVSWREGDRDAVDRVFPLVYSELRRLARAQLRRSGRNQTLDTTGLVHEAYLKLVDRHGSTPKDRQHFMAVAAKAMRHILVDHARGRVAKKRGGGQPRVTFDEERQQALSAKPRETAEILAIDSALQQLERVDERLGRVVELRFFAGLSVAETAEAMELSERTVKRDWQKARLFLHEALAG